MLYELSTSILVLHALLQEGEYLVIYDGQPLLSTSTRPYTKFPRKMTTQRKVYHWHYNVFSIICRRQINQLVSGPGKLVHYSSDCTPSLKARRN